MASGFSWLRTRRAWVEESVAEERDKPVERGVVAVPLPKARAASPAA
jgi:hypothetical protein